MDGLNRMRLRSVRRLHVGVAMLLALLTFTASMGVMNAQTVGQLHTFSVNVTFDPNSPLIVDAVTPLRYEVTLTRDGGAVVEPSLTYAGPGDITGFTADTFQTAFGLPTDAAGDAALAADGVDLDFSITPSAVGNYELTLELVHATDPTILLAQPISTATFTVTEPVVVTIPVVVVGDLELPVVNQVFVGVSEGVQAEASTSANGVTASATAPAGVLPAGTVLSAAGIADLGTLASKAPVPDGSTLQAGVVFQARANGVALDGPFNGQVILQINLPAGSIEEGTAPSDLVLVHWDGSAWVEVNASITVHEDGSATIVASVDHFTVFAVLVRPGHGAFTPDLVASGFTLSSWGGGSIDQMVAEVGSSGSIWVYVDGAPVGYTVGAPTFVNAAFVALFPDGVPAGTAAMVAR